MRAKNLHAARSRSVTRTSGEKKPCVTNDNRTYVRICQGLSHEAGSCRPPEAYGTVSANRDEELHHARAPVVGTSAFGPACVTRHERERIVPARGSE